MPKIKIVESINHPIESCVPDLVKLLQEIYQRQEIMYQVPYEEITNINVELDSSPDEDISVFNNKYAFVQSQCNRVVSILIDLKQELKRWQIFKNRVDIFYRKARNLLLIERPEIKNLKNKELQEAATQNELSDLKDIVDGVDNVIEELEHDVDIVKLKKENLESVNVNLNRQQKVVEDMMALSGIIGIRGVKVKLVVSQ